MRKKDATLFALISFVQVFLLSVLILFTPTNPSSFFHWRDEHSYTIIEIKCWIDVNGTYGFEPVAMVRMIPLESNAEPEGYNWVHEPFRLDNRYGYRFQAPPEMYNRRFLFWQSEKTSMIIPNQTLILESGFSSDSWWMNYG